MLVNGSAADSARNNAQALQTETGVKGASILFLLCLLYGFDPVRDMTVDRMHNCFNMLKREFLEQMWPEMGENRNRDVNGRNPNDGGVIDRGEFAADLHAVPWTTEQKASGIARLQNLTDRLCGWKPAEFNK